LLALSTSDHYSKGRGQKNMTASRKAAGKKSKAAKLEKETLRDLKPRGEKSGRVKGGAPPKTLCTAQMSGCTGTI
jgi:hypothetical protein